MLQMLNVNQAAAVEAGDEPLLVVAGPGAGKTTVLQRRIERLLSREDVQSAYSRVLAITFTNVAANNLRLRLELSPDIIRERVDILTFHGFAARLLQQHGSHLGLSPDFVIANNAEDRNAVLEQAVFELVNEGAIASNSRQNLLPLIARLYETVADAESIRGVLDTTIDVDAVTAIFERYAEVSIRLNQLDFPLLVFLANRLLWRKKAIARQTRSVYRYICVDEFQDTNDAQFRLIRIIAEDNAAGLFLLADQDQVIYQWNGATPLRLREATDIFNLTILELPTSYRCPSDIISAANELIAHNETRFIKPRFQSALTDKSHHIIIKAFETAKDEADWVAQEISKVPAPGKSSAVLARNRQSLLPVLNALKQMSIAAEIPTPRYEWISPPLVMLYAMLKLGNRPTSEKCLTSLLESFYGITGVSFDSQTLVAEANAEESTALDVFMRQATARARSSEFGRLASYVKDSLIARKQFRDLSRLFFEWVDQLQLKEANRPWIGDYASEKSLWQKLENTHVGLQSEDIALDEFLRRLDLESKTPVVTGAVPLLTVHAAKGLEFDNVFLIGAAERQFPTYQAVDKGPTSESMEEERRSFFVAITRTRERLAITYARRYSGRAAQPSRFLSEMGEIAL